MRSRTELMFQVVTLKGIAGIYDADDGFSNVMARIVATIHSYFLVDTRIPGAWRACRRAQRAISIVVACIVDLEQRRIRALARVEIVNRNRRVVALRIGYGPLLELHVLGA